MVRSEVREAKVSRSILSEELSTQKAISENDIVEANAELQVLVSGYNLSMRAAIIVD